jgi:hypothetical protein
MIKKTIFILSLSIFLSNISCSSYQETWVNFTNANGVNAVAIEGNYM